MKTRALLALVAALSLTWFAATHAFSQNESQPAASASSEDDAAPESPTKTKFRGRLPAYYGQIGLSRRQKENIYAIQGKYAGQIEELENQIAELEAERDEEIDSVLNDFQRQELKLVIEQARKKRLERQ